MCKKSGFTLIEILVSAVIFALVMAGLLGVFASGNRILMHTRERIIGAELGKFFIDPMQVNVRQDQWTATNPLLISGAPTIESINNQDFTYGYTTGAVAGTDLRRVTTTINWDEPAL
ncbi:MAG: hypothetical protein COV73_01965 [Candidatus Omnitrophica bacterium CG11_big_fil_rev_8_21_14_0_20_43_6]|nr:MAG: hypothetical protein COV73_01965 [Candidatus Omnitrophica bacterium CG11_big_fil_rev_8_21_14_0_20_43_6]